MLPDIYITVLVSAVIKTVTMTSQEVGGALEQVGVDVGVMVGQLVDDYLSGCHLVLITTVPHSLITTNILRRLSEGTETRVVVEAQMVFLQDQLAKDHLLHGLWGDGKTTCRGLLLDLTDANNTHLVLRFLKEAELRKLPDIRVLVVGGRTRVKDVLLHHSLRNTIHALYLALNDLTLQSLTIQSLTLQSLTLQSLTLQSLTLQSPTLQSLTLQSLTLQSLTLHKLPLNSRQRIPLAKEQFQDFFGSKMRFSVLASFPYTDYTLDSDKPGSTVSLRNCLDARMLFLLSKKLNISFEIREIPDRSYGVQKNGNFTGMVGHLQREESDICGSMTTVVGIVVECGGVERDPVVAAEIMVVTASHMFPGVGGRVADVLSGHNHRLQPLICSQVLVGAWLMFCLVITTGVGGRVADVLSGHNHRLQLLICSQVLVGAWLMFCLVITTGVGGRVADVLSGHNHRLQLLICSQVLVGAWLMFCLVITTGYSSSLVAHLSVQEKTKPPDTLEDLVTRNNWKWAIETQLLFGASLLYFSQHTDPKTVSIHHNTKYYEIKLCFLLTCDHKTQMMTQGLEKVRAGDYSFITIYINIKVVIDSLYSESSGPTPYYISYLNLLIFPTFGWGFRKGAPFYNRFMQLMLQLQDVGITSRWTKEVIAERVKENRAAAALNPQAIQSPTPFKEDSRVVLGMNHLQGAFYMLLLGTGVAFLTLLGENLAHWCSSPQ
nr:uncharacterized protein LOC128695304 [Cherax quadricarinatus]